MSQSELELALAFQIKVSKLPKPETEFIFHPVRRFRFDFAWPEHMLAVEVDGGTWNYGRHNRAEGIHSDSEKFSLAVTMGWRVMRLDKQMVEDASGVRLIEEALKRC